MLHIIISSLNMTILSTLLGVAEGPSEPPPKKNTMDSPSEITEDSQVTLSKSKLGQNIIEPEFFGHG